MCQRGDCLYRSLQVGLGLNLTVPQLRNLTANQMLANVTLKQSWAPENDQFGPQTFEQYVQATRQNMFGDQYTLMILANELSFDYTIIDVTSRVATQTLNNHRNRIFLGYMRNESHYVHLVHEQVGFCYV